MSECKYSKCSKVLDNPRANTCCDAHRKAWERETRTNNPDNPDTSTRTNNPDTDKQATRTGDNPDNTPQPGQPIDSQVVDPVSIQADTGMVPAYVVPATEPINWADPDKDYSTIARRIQGAVLLPGDPGYSGVCKLVDGAWIVP